MGLKRSGVQIQQNIGRFVYFSIINDKNDMILSIINDKFDIDLSNINDVFVFLQSKKRERLWLIKT